MFSTLNPIEGFCQTMMICTNHAVQLLQSDLDWFPKWRSRFQPWKGHGYGSKQGHFEEPGLCCVLVYINRFHTFITLSFPNRWVLKANLVSFYSSLFSPMFSCHRLIFSSAKELLHLCLECLCIIVKVSRAGRDGADSCHPSSGNCVVFFCRTMVVTCCYIRHSCCLF